MDSVDNKNQGVSSTKSVYSIEDVSSTTLYKKRKSSDSNSELSKGSNDSITSINYSLPYNESCSKITREITEPMMPVECDFSIKSEEKVNVSILSVSDDDDDIIDSVVETGIANVNIENSKTAQSFCIENSLSTVDINNIASLAMRSENASLKTVSELVYVESDIGLTDTSGSSESTSTEVFSQKTNDDKIEKVEIITTTENKKDKFCWSCNKEGGHFYVCIGCPRVYHIKCYIQVYDEDVSTDDFMCPECTDSLQADNMSIRSSQCSISVDKLCTSLLNIVHILRGKKGSHHFNKPVSLKEFPTYKNYIVNPMDLTMLEKNINNKNYGCTSAFYSDFMWIVHNSIIFNSNTAKITLVAKNLQKVVKREVDEINTCAECYYNNLTPHSDGFIEVCQKPHLLLWAKLKGYSPWPAKMLSCKDGLLDCRFFGAHDKAKIPNKDCYIFSEEPPKQTRVKKNTSLADGIRECERHIEKLKEKYGTFRYAPKDTPFLSGTIEGHMKLLLPNYVYMKPDSSVKKPNVQPIQQDKILATKMPTMKIMSTSNPVINTNCSRKISNTDQHMDVDDLYLVEENNYSEFNSSNMSDGSEGSGSIIAEFDKTASPAKTAIQNVMNNYNKVLPKSSTGFQVYSTTDVLNPRVILPKIRSPSTNGTTTNIPTRLIEDNIESTTDIPTKRQKTNDECSRSVIKTENITLSASNNNFGTDDFSQSGYGIEIKQSPPRTKLLEKTPPNCITSQLGFSAAVNTALKTPSPNRIPNTSQIYRLQSSSPISTITSNGEQDMPVERILSKYTIQKHSGDLETLFESIFKSMAKNSDSNTRNMFLQNEQKALQQRYEMKIEEIKREHEMHIAEIIKTSNATYKFELSCERQKFKEEIAKIKRELWCVNCLKSAKYYCCWNTAYCSENCQKMHWVEHMYLCKNEKVKTSNNNQSEPPTIQLSGDSDGVKMTQNTTGSETRVDHHSFNMDMNNSMMRSSKQSLNVNNNFISPKILTKSFETDITTQPDNNDCS